MSNKSLISWIFDYFCFVFYRIYTKIYERAIFVNNKRCLTKFGSCGQGAALYGCVRISSKQNVNMGDNVHIGDNAYIRAEG